MAKSASRKARPKKKPAPSARAELVQPDDPRHSFQAMAGLAERERLRGKVRRVYPDPSYGIRFNSNLQWSMTNRDVEDGNAAHITSEPEQ